MDDLIFTARRASAAATAAAARTAEPNDIETRFRTLVQSPLRAGILRYLSARPEESFDVEALMQTFGRLRLDVENCVRELADFGVAQTVPGNPVRYTMARPASDQVVELLDHFLERRAAVSTEDQSQSVQRFREMIGRDEKMLIVFEWIRTAAKSDISVLILGPTGSGKEVVARMIHELSRRSAAKFQAVNCAALPERQVDIPVLAQRFLNRYCAAQGMPLDSKTFSREAIDLLVNYQWPGNIRELESTVSRAALSAPGRAIRATDIEFLHATAPSVLSQTGDRLPSLAEAERAHIVRVLEAVEWNKKEASRVLDISRGTLYRKIVEYGLEPEPRAAGARRGREGA